MESYVGHCVICDSTDPCEFSVLMKASKDADLRKYCSHESNRTDNCFKCETTMDCCKGIVHIQCLNTWNVACIREGKIPRCIYCRPSVNMFSDIHVDKTPIEWIEFTVSGKGAAVGFLTNEDVKFNYIGPVPCRPEIDYGHLVISHATGGLRSWLENNSLITAYESYCNIGSLNQRTVSVSPYCYDLKTRKVINLLDLV
jgi:hypothetical protein